MFGLSYSDKFLQYGRKKFELNARWDLVDKNTKTKINVNFETLYNPGIVNFETDTKKAGLACSPP